MPTFRPTLLVLLAGLAAPGLAGPALAAAPAAGAGTTTAPTAIQAECQRFLDLYNSLYVSLYKADSAANWSASTDVSDEHEGERTGTGNAMAAFYGDAEVIRATKGLLAHKTELTPLQVRQLNAIIFKAGANPGTIPDVVRARVAAESRAAGVQDGFVYCFVPRSADGTCPAPKTANDIDDVLLNSKDMNERLTAWTASKEIGRPLKPELAELQKLRNQVAREMGYSSYFGLMVAEYDMTVPEMMTLLDGFSADMAPLYNQLSIWATHKLADRYGQPMPQGGVPAQWYPNRWAQEWDGLVEGANLDPYFKNDPPANIVKRAEQLYVSMGFSPLPQSFWDNSDLYPVAAGDSRHKNSHASAWHMDLGSDVRSLMSVESDSQWFYTANHELGHIYYYNSYARPEVPPLLREGANRGFHEGVGELISLAAGQLPYLRQQGILPANVKINPTQALLVDAMERTVAFIPWSAGVMTHFEYELYEKDLPPDQWQARWWGLVKQYQGVVPPSADRLTDPTACDACTKTHIIDDPAGYYDYAVATVIKFQLHEHIAKVILKQDPHACNYYGNKEVGDFLRSILEKGATEDWRSVLKEATGEDISTRAMVEYFAPLQTWLVKENKKQKKG